MKHNPIPFALAAILSGTPIPHYATPYEPEMAYGDGYDDTSCPALNPADIQAFTSADINRIVGNIAKAMARKTPYTDILAGGTIAAGMSDTVRAIVQERAVLNQSLVRPQFRPDIEMCGEVGEAAETGTTEYSYFLATLRGMGPLVCVNTMRNQFEGSYLAAEDALKKEVLQLTNSDIRATLTDRSGSKMVIHTNSNFIQMYSGDMNAIDIPFTNALGLPDSPVNFAVLDDLSTFLREDLLVEGFEGTQSEPLLKFIGSQEINRRLRNEIGIREDHRYLAAGHYDLGMEELTKYTWEGPYRGYAFGVDTQPLRFSSVDAFGQPLYIEPEIPVKTSKGVGARVNPAWAAARFEIALVMGADSFARLTPAMYNGEGTWKFPSQVSMGELIFQVIKDNCRNVWGDYGRHFYQIKRAIKPMRPHSVCAIAYKRANSDYNLTPVSDFSSYSTADSL